MSYAIIEEKVRQGHFIDEYTYTRETYLEYTSYNLMQQVIEAAEKLGNKKYDIITVVPADFLRPDYIEKQARIERRLKEMGVS